MKESRILDLSTSEFHFSSPTQAQNRIDTEPVKAKKKHNYQTLIHTILTMNQAYITLIVHILGVINEDLNLL